MSTNNLVFKRKNKEFEVKMKFPYFKTLALVGMIAVAWNCSSDSVDAASAALNQGSGELDAPAATNCWLIQGDVNYVVIPGNDAFIVTDTDGNNIGFYDIASASIIDAAGTPIATGIVLTDYPQLTPEKTIVYPDGKITDIAGNVIFDPNAGQQIPEVSSSSVVQDLPVSSAIADLPKSSSSVQKEEPKSSSIKDQPKSSSSAKSSSSKDQPKSSSEEKQTSGSITATGSLNQTVAKGSSISSIVFSNVTQEPQRDWKAYFLQGKLDQNAKTYTVTGTIPGELGDGSKYTEKFTFNDGSFEVTITIGQGGQPKSSSSAKSSSSVKSSSSQQQQQSSSSQGGGQTDAEAAKYVNAGSGGQGGWATRYWDCCMPSCAWNENSGGNPTKTCDAKGKNPVSGGQNICAGGQQTTCTTQMPIIASDKVAYAFAAVPAADGGKCGKCFALTFTGKGKYETKANHEALAGKTLVVMASNIGGDVSHGQFDIMIPGGGFGMFNGCSQMGWNIPNNTTQYGGLLSDCEKEVGYDGDLLNKRKECLTKKCNSAFASDTQAKEGCLFLATWMEAAGNPEHTFKEVECPQALRSKW